jgi:hypothetical protein
MQISVKHDVRAIVGLLSAHSRQVPFATSQAINAILKTSAPAVKAEMQRVFDRPTPWTLNSYRVLKWANKRDLTGIVGFKDMGPGSALGGHSTSAAGSYLQPEMKGTVRPQKRLEVLLTRRGILTPGEFLVPSTSQQLDQYGNVSRGVIQKILANLQASTDVYSQTPKGGARGGKKKAEYFYSKTKSGMRAIWRSIGRHAVPAFIVVRAAPKYKKIFDHVAIVQGEVTRRFSTEFKIAYARAVATAR